MKDGALTRKQKGWAIKSLFSPRSSYFLCNINLLSEIRVMLLDWFIHFLALETEAQWTFPWLQIWWLHTVSLSITEHLTWKRCWLVFLSCSPLPLSLSPISQASDIWNCLHHSSGWVDKGDASASSQSISCPLLPPSASHRNLNWRSWRSFGTNMLPQVIFFFFFSYFWDKSFNS